MVVHQKNTELMDRVKLHRKYMHYKGNEYLVVNFCIIEATWEIGVMYVHPYTLATKDSTLNLPFIRPIDNFLENVDLDGKTVQRFALLS